MATKTLYELVKASKRADGTLMDRVIAIIQANDLQEFVRTAQEIDAEYPVQLEKGKDVNRKARNNDLSRLRMPIRRACKRLDRAALTLEKVGDEWTVKEVTPRPSARKQSAKAIAKYVTDHLSDPAFIQALHEAGYSRIQERAHLGPIVLPALDFSRRASNGNGKRAA